MFLRNLAGNRLLRNRLTAGTHGCGGDRSRQAPVKMAPAPSAYTTAAPTVKHFRVDVLNKDKLVSIAVPAERNRYDQV